MRLRPVLLGLSMVLLVSACAGRMTRPDALPTLVDVTAIAAAQAVQVRRVAWLEAHPQWSLEGRIAISNAGKGGSGRIDWQQQGDTYVVSLSAPVTRQSWRMSGGPDGALLEGVQGGPREGSDPAQLLLEATGWQIPVEALADWARGKASEPDTLAQVAYAQDGRLQRLQQDGWQIDYLQWQPPVGQRPSLPARIEAQRGDAKVRLIIDSWAFPAQ
jgi:outer membrane lipoprotein LolB